MASAASAIAIIGDVAQLEPIAFGLVAALVSKLKGKSDADILAGDAQDWAAIIITAHAAANAAPPTAIGPEPVKNS